MPHYLVRWKFALPAVKALVEKPQNREAAAREVIESFGGRLAGYWFTFGDHDGALLAEFPDNTRAAAFSMRVSSTGTFAALETTPLLTAAEAEQAMHQASAPGTTYRAPIG